MGGIEAILLDILGIKLYILNDILEVTASILITSSRGNLPDYLYCMQICIFICW